MRLLWPQFSALSLVADARVSARVLVTGAGGFVGNILCELLAQSGFTVRAALRAARPLPAAVAEQIAVGDIGAGTVWLPALEGVDYIVHAAARVHVMNEAVPHRDLYDETNAQGTLRLASAAASAGVRRFVYLSSVKVNGEENADHSYMATDEPKPQDAYGVSKWRAEQYLRQVGEADSLEYAIVRPPLVYGPGVRANFLRLLKWIDEERLVPLGAIRNRRSMVSVWNLSDLVLNLLTNPAGRNRTWMVSDGVDLSTPDLIRFIARTMGRRARLLSVPGGMLKLLGRAAGKGPEISRLCGSLSVDIAETRTALGWTPALTMEAGLARTVEWYLAGRPSCEH